VQIKPAFFKTADFREIAYAISVPGWESSVGNRKQSSRWIFYPLDDPYRLFFNNDAGSSGIAENMAKFFDRLCIRLSAYSFFAPGILASIVSGFRKSVPLRPLRSLRPLR